MSVPWVLLRGLAREQGHWGAFASHLESAVAPARVVMLDLPGTGARHRERSPTTVGAIVEDCRTQLHRLGLAPPLRLFGLSLGGMVVLQWALRHPRELACGVVVNTSAAPFAPWSRRLRPRLWWPLFATLVDRDGERAEARILRCTSAWPERHPGVPAAWAALRRTRPVAPANVLRQLVAAARHRLPPQPPAAPLLLLSSAGDRLVDPDCTRRLARQWCPWGVVHAEHPAAGHDLPLDDPQWIVEQLRAFSPARD